MKIPKILIFTVTYEGKDYILDEFLKHTQAIKYPNFKHIFIDNSEKPDYFAKLTGLGLNAYRVQRGNNSREAIARAQNFARKMAIEENYDYILSLESDILVPPDIVWLLLRHSKPVVSALYMLGIKKEGLSIPCITIPEWREDIGAWGSRLLNLEEFKDYLHKGLKQVQAAGMGCCLMHKSTFLTTGFTYDPRFTGHSDIYFFNQMFERKIPVFVDTDILCAHENSNWLDVKDR